MRTTLDIDADILIAIKERAHNERKSAGRVVSSILRDSLNGNSTPSREKYIYKNGFRVLGHREGEVITMEHIQRIMDEEGI